MYSLQIKKRHLIIFGVFLSPIISGQTCTVAKLPELLKLADIDSIQKIERLAALKFHDLINLYRKTNKLDTLCWDEALWVACRNHNIWMASNSELSHSEKSGTKNFTGSRPEDRYIYATAEKGKSSWSGENALYNYSDHGNTIEKISNNIAIQSFEQWKRSPGHNSNMLGLSHKSHGVSFYLSKEGRVYGTDLFASSIDKQFCSLTKSQIQDVYSIKTISVNSSQKTNATEKIAKVNIQKLELDIVSNLYAFYGLEKSNCAIKKSNPMEKSAIQHSKYMSAAKQLTHKELKNKRNFSGENEEKRIIKATYGFYIISKYKTKINESVAYIEVDAKNIDEKNLANEIQTRLDKE